MNIEAGVKLGRYKLVQQLGRGGMGTVWKAADTSLDRHVAVKILHERHKNNEKVLSRFLREPVALGRLDHPNIARIHLLDEVDEIPYFVMDHIEGESLDRLITPDFRPPVKRALKILIRVADALDTAHKNGIIHRDVKPANIIVRKGDSPVLTDFSVARVDTWTTKAALEGPLAALQEMEKHDTPHDKLAGTPAYVAPERWLRREYDARIDIYSFGVTMFHLLTGSLPFIAPELKEIRDEHLKKPVPKLPANLPPAAVAIVTRCLQKTPQHRFGSAAELRGALKSALDEISAEDGAADKSPFKGGEKAEPLLQSLHTPVFTARTTAPNLLVYTRAASILLLFAVMVGVFVIFPNILLKKLSTTLGGAGAPAGGIPTSAPGIVLEEDFSDYLLERQFKITGRVRDFRRLSDGAWIHLDAGDRDILLWSPRQTEPVKRNAKVTARGILVKNREPVEPKYFIYIEKESNIEVLEKKSLKVKKFKSSK